MTIGRLLVLSLVVAAFGIASGTASAGVAPASATGSAGTAASAGECAGPCPTIFFLKGGGSGRIDVDTVWSDGSVTRDSCGVVAARSQCTLELPADPVGNVSPETATVRLTGASGSQPAGIELCPRPETVTANECRMLAGSPVTMCALFRASGEPPIPASDCPPPSIQLFKKGDAPGTVTVTGSSGRVDVCGSACFSKPMSQWGVGEMVTLRAAPDAGGTFVRWDGCPSTAPDGSCQFTLTRSVTICAVMIPGGTAPMSDPSCPWSTPKYVAQPKAPVSVPPSVTSKCTIPGSPYGDRLNGTARADVLCGRAGNDLMYGRAGHDLLLGGAGKDKLWGHAGNDRLRGEGGNDILYGGPGADTLEGGAGNDVIYAKGDRTKDKVVCGRGRDTVYADRIDQVARDCEVVRRR